MQVDIPTDTSRPLDLADASIAEAAARLGIHRTISIDPTSMSTEMHGGRRWSICYAERLIAVRDQKLRLFLGILETQDALFGQRLTTVGTTGQLLPSGE